MSESLGTRFPAALERARGIVQMYRDIGPAGAFGLAMLQPIVAEAERAWAEQDTIAMVRIWPQLSEMEG